MLVRESGPSENNGKATSLPSGVRNVTLMSAAWVESALAIRTNASNPPVEPSARNQRVAGAAIAGELWPPCRVPFAQYIERSTTMGWPLVLSTTAETACALARPGTVFTFSVYRLVALTVKECWIGAMPPRCR